MAHDFQTDIDSVALIESVPALLEVICRITGMGFAAVARVTEDRWIACAVRDEISFGLAPGGELKVETTICNEIRESGQAVVIDHVAEDMDFCRHPTPAMYGFQSYISMPIFRADGRFFGTLCAIDPKPAKVTRAEVVHMFRLFADLIAFQLEAKERVAASEAALLNERQTAELREQFIAVLGHDLRNPLASIQAGTWMLRKEVSGAKASSILEGMQKSVGRMSELIGNVLDFARGRLGGGLSVEREHHSSLGSTLEQVVAELRNAWPGRTIDVQLDLPDPMAADPARMAQLLSNLVSNALTHGAVDGPVRVSASTGAGMFELSVTNQGDPIPAESRQRLFQPFFRGTGQRGRQGLGLGLYIASEIARAHCGALDVVSTAEETCFTLRMPLN